MGECTTATPVKTSVWWDLDRCAVSPGCGDPHRINHNIIAALAAAGCRGSVSIVAYGDASRVAPGVLEALSATGISLNHVPAGSKDGVDKKMLVDMLFWAFDNPPPGNYLLISGDQDFSDLLHRLKMKQYGILLAQPPNASSRALVTAARTVWLWESLAIGVPRLVESTHSRNVPDCNRNLNNSDSLKCSQSKIRSVYSKGDINAKAGNQYGVKPLPKYVKKTNLASSFGSDQNQVESVDGISDDSARSTMSELDRSSVSSLSSSEAMEEAKIDQSSVLGTPFLSQSSAQKLEVSAQLEQMETSRGFIDVEEPSTSSEYKSRNGSLDGISNAHCHQMDQQPRCCKAQNKLHSEYNRGDNNGKAGNECKVKPLQKYVMKRNTAPSSAANRVDSVLDHTSPLEASSLLQSSVKKPGASTDLPQVRDKHKSILGKKPCSSTEHPSRDGNHAKVDHTSPLCTSTLQSCAQKPVLSTPLHQVRASNISILGKKTTTSTEHGSRDGNHDFGVSVGHYHAQRQLQSSQAQNKLHFHCNAGDSNGYSGYKVKQHQEYVKKTYFI